MNRDGKLGVKVWKIVARYKESWNKIYREAGGSNYVLRFSFEEYKYCNLETYGNIVINNFKNIMWKRSCQGNYIFDGNTDSIFW